MRSTFLCGGYESRRVRESRHLQHLARVNDRGLQRATTHLVIAGNAMLGGQIQDGEYFPALLV